MDKNIPVISIHNLNMSYSTKTVLENINLDVHKGEIIGYIGPNGAGKSTTIKILLGMIRNFKGTVEIFGQNILEDNIDYKKRIGYVPELSEIYDNLTPKEYLTFIGELYDMDSKDIDSKSLKLMELFNIKYSYHSRISSFSKGMKQKVLIISSLLHNPDILFLDEPLSGLDANSILIFKEILSTLASQGKTIFYSSHMMDVVEKISNRIILINGGQVIADGSFEELKENCSEGSLESIFNQLTNFTEHKNIAQEFICTIEN